MIERLEKSIRNGLRGKFTHIDPLKAIDGLTPETARKVPENAEHSCWHYLYHIVYWQDLMLGALRKESVDWPKNNEQSWPSDEMTMQDDDWLKLVDQFEKGLEEAESMTKTIESEGDLPAWPKVPAFAAYLVLNQHNAYHLGELVATRQALGIWPPPDYKKTF